MLIVEHNIFGSFHILIILIYNIALLQTYSSKKK